MAEQRGSEEVTRGESITASYAAAGVRSADPFSLLAMRRNAVGRSILAAAMLSFLIGYGAPMARALTQSAPAEPLASLSVPTFNFPVLRNPTAPRASAPTSHATSPRSASARVHRTAPSAASARRVQVLTNAYTTVPPPAKKQKPGPQPPVVEDTVGAPPLISADSSAPAAAVSTPVTDAGSSPATSTPDQ